MENPKFTAELPLSELWAMVVMKSFISTAYCRGLGMSGKYLQSGIPRWCGGTNVRRQPVCAYGKDGRLGNSDERLGRLTYMRAFGTTPKPSVLAES